MSLFSIIANLKIKNKLFLILIIYLLVVALGFAYLLVSGERYLTDKSIDDAQRITEFIAKSSAIPLQTFDYATIVDLVNKVTKGEELAFVNFYDNKSRQIPLTFENHKKEKGDYKDFKVVKIPVYFMGENIGVVETGISLIPLKQEISDWRWQMTFIFLILMLIVLKGTAYVSHTITLPVARLMEGVNKIESGDMDFKIESSGDDEIGQLTKAFNAMTEKLRQSQRKLKEYSSNLEHEVESRTGELRRKNEELREINDELDHFTYIVSHDLKEPLRSISAYSKFIAESAEPKLDEEEKGFLSRICYNVSLLQNFITDLLEISRISRKKNVLQEINIFSVIDQIKENFSFIIIEKKAQIIVKQPIPLIYGDLVRITEVFANLIGNALKFMDKKEAIVEIGSSEEGEFYKFYIKDNGIGIDSKYFNMIFEIFQRLHRREEYEGTGAGLAICKKIIERHFGKIWLESEVGKGSTFFFTIPKDKEFYAKKNNQGQISEGKDCFSKEG